MCDRDPDGSSLLKIDLESSSFTVSPNGLFFYIYHARTVAVGTRVGAAMSGVVRYAIHLVQADLKVDLESSSYIYLYTAVPGLL